MGETQEKKVSLVQTILFTICSVLVLDSLAGAPAFAGVRSITMWLIFAVIFFIPYGLLNAELGSTYPDAGGITSWCTRAFGEHVGVQVGWFYWINVAFWMPAVFLTFAYWLSYTFFPAASVWVIAAISLIMSWLIVWIGYRGVELSVTLTSIASICKMAILVIFGILGAAYVIKNGPANAFTIDDFKITSMSDMSSGLAIIVYNLLGFELIGSIGDKIDNPEKTIPKMSILAGVAITVLYVIGTFGMLAALPAETIDTMDGFYYALEELCSVFGAGQKPILGILVIVSCLTLVSNMISWTLGANESLIAAELDKRNRFLGARSRYGTAGNLYIVMGVLSTVLLILNFLLGSEEANAIFWDIFSFSLVIFMIPYLVMFAAAIRLRYSDAERKRVYKVPGGNAGMWVCGILCFGCICICLYYMFADDIAAGNRFALWVKIIGTVLSAAVGEYLYRAGGKKC
ncbi:MAG: amino acid permease [Ruminococcus sp.]|nr:amino acid permease [Ruminococcus sp.]